ncbi:hypothetical protein MSPP1_001721 [Malassezia sp. CBS 17886]|nr:hypothetical protein MSPP1_001721 [Malassezia sp. CBS 17886]
MSRRRGMARVAKHMPGHAGKTDGGSVRMHARATRDVHVPSADDDDGDEELAFDAEKMADGDAAGVPDSRTAFLSRVRLPDVSAKGAQGRARTRLRDEKRMERREQWEQAKGGGGGGDDGSDASTDMEGASDSETEGDEGDEDADGDDLLEDDAEEEDGLDAEESDPEDTQESDLEGTQESDLEDTQEGDTQDTAHTKKAKRDNASLASLEDTYLATAAKRTRREDRASADAREARADRRLPIRDEHGGVVEQDAFPDEALGSRAVFDEPDASEEEETHALETPLSSAAHSSRFGMRAPYDIVCLAADPSTEAAGLALAREQIAQLASQTVGDPELGTNWLKRLLVFSQPKVAPPPERGPGKRVPVHEYIRQLALLSLLAVLVDIIPGYRIRALSEQEELAKVSQDVARRRDWEQGLVHVYRDFLECCERELRDAASPLARVALRCFCMLLMRVPHFNYRKNLLAAVVSHLSRRAWTDSSAQCYTAVVQLLRNDAGGEVSLEAIMLLYRMIKERKLAVHPNVLDVLTHLRLRDELSKAHRSGPMGSASAPARSAKRAAPTPAQNRRADPRKVRKGLAVHQSKKEAKKNRELAEIERELAEADAGIDAEERERNQSETLKLVFALYFRVLKTPNVPPMLLASALEGIVHFAHHVSVDFFRDLIQVLRSLLQAAMAQVDDVAGGGGGEASPLHVARHTALACIAAALELLRGQGEALEIDIGDFFASLYQLLLPLSLSTLFEEAAALPAAPDAPRNRARIAGLRRWSEADLVFYTLDAGFVRVPRQAVFVSIERTAAVLKRLLTCALQWPTGSALRALQLAHAILARTAVADTRFDALLDNRDSVRDGQYDAYARIPESARVLASGEAAWELQALRQSHANAQVREAADALLHWEK